MSGEQDWAVPPNGVKSPPFSTSGPRIELGLDDLPSSLLNRPDFTPIGAQIFYFDNDEYYFIATGYDSGNDPIVLTGTYSLNDGLVAVSRFAPTGAGFAFGDSNIGDNPATFSLDSNWLLQPGYSFGTSFGSSFTIGSDGEFTIDQISAPRGPRLYVASTSDTGGIGTGGTTALSSAAFTFKDGRAYECSIGGTAFASGVTNVMAAQINTAVTGPLCDLGGFGPGTSADPFGTYASQVVRVTGGADVSVAAVRVFIRSSSGTINWRGGATYPRYLMVKDCGEAADFPGAKAI